MKYVDFGNTGLKVSRFGLGCMRFPQITDKNGETHTDENAAIEIIRYAIDHGVNYIDTAYVYKESEVIVGKALRDGYRQKVILATKQPTFILKDEPGEQERYFAQQLQRLQTDYIDVYFLHNLGTENWKTVQKVNGLDFLDSLKKQGKIKFAAASVHSDLSHFKTVADAYAWDLMMIQYNYYDKFNQAGIDGAKYVKAKGMSLAIMESNRGGMLAADVPERVRSCFDANDSIPDYERSFKWLISQSEPTVILSGCSSVEQVKQNIAVFDRYDTGCISQEDEAQYDKARAAWNSLTNINCTGCRYCVPCPRGVNIPGVFSLYNSLSHDLADQHPSDAKKAYESSFIAAKADASQCIGCKACEAKCPQGIAIASELKAANLCLLK